MAPEHVVTIPNLIAVHFLLLGFPFRENPQRHFSCPASCPRPRPHQTYLPSSSSVANGTAPPMAVGAGLGASPQAQT